MSKRPIQKGDLVMVVKPCLCCAATDSLGVIFTVASIHPQFLGQCRYCGIISRRDSATTGEVSVIGPVACDVRRLKRLDPGDVSEDVPADDEVTV